MARFFVNQDERDMVIANPLSATAWRAMYRHSPLKLRPWMSKFIHLLDGPERDLQTLLMCITKLWTTPALKKRLKKNEHECLNDAITYVERFIHTRKRSGSRLANLAAEMDINIKSMAVGAQKNHLRDPDADTGNADGWG